MLCTSCLWLHIHSDPVTWLTLYSPLRQTPPSTLHTPSHSHIPVKNDFKELKKKRNQICKQQFVCKVRGKETETYLKLMSAPQDVSPVSVVQG